MREKRKAAIAGEAATKRLAVELLEGAPVSPYTLRASLPLPLRTPSPTPDEQIARELNQLLTAHTSELNLGFGGAGVLESPSSRNGNLPVPSTSSNTGSLSTPASGSGVGRVTHTQTTPAPTLLARVQQLNRHRLENERPNQQVQQENTIVGDVAGVGGGGTTLSKILTFKLTGASLSPPRPPTNKEGDVTMTMTGTHTPAQALAPKAQPYPRAPGQLGGSKLETQLDPRGQGLGQVHLSPPRAGGYQSDHQTPRQLRNDSPGGKGSAGSQNQTHSSPASTGNRPGEMNSSLPRAQPNSIAQSQQQSSPPRGASQQMLSQGQAQGPAQPQIRLNPPTLPSGFGLLLSSTPATPLFPPPGGVLPPELLSLQLPRLLQHLSHPPSDICRPPLPLDPKRITLGLPQHEIDRNPLPDYNHNNLLRNPSHKVAGMCTAAKNSPAVREWAELPAVSSTARPRPPTPPTPVLQRMAVGLQADAKARGVELAANPSTEQLKEMTKRALIYKDVLSKAPVHTMSGVEQGRILTEATSMQGFRYGKNSPDEAVKAVFRSVHAVPNSGPNGIGLRLDNGIWGAVADIEKKESGDPLLTRRMVKREPIMKVLAWTEERIEQLVIRQKQTAGQGEVIVIDEWERRMQKRREAESDAEAAQQIANQGIWKAFMNADGLPDALWDDAYWRAGARKELMLAPHPATVRQYGCTEEIRLNKVLVETFKNFHAALKEEKEKIIKPIDRPPPAIVFQNLALSKIRCAKLGGRGEAPLFGTWWVREKMEQMDMHGCTFCLFDCDYGVNDARVLLPDEAASGYCHECHTSCMSANEVWKDLIQGRSDEPDHDKLVAYNLQTAEPPLKELSEDAKHKKQAREFGRDPTRKQALQFLYPKSVFKAAVKSGKAGKGKAGVSTAIGGAPVSSAPLNDGDGALGGLSIGAQHWAAPIAPTMSDASGPAVVPGVGKPPPLFAANKPPRPSPLATMTEMSPMKDTFTGAVGSASTNVQVPSTPPRPAREQTTTNSNSNDSISAAAPSNDTDTTMTDTPLITETFGCIFIPESPTSSQQSSFSDASPERRRQLHRSLSDSNPNIGPPRPNLKRSFSAIDGMDITPWKPIGFCRGNPWGQIDVLKAKICNECRYEKWEIVRHRHIEWKLMVLDDSMSDGEKFKQSRNCMICLNLGMFVCADCPLRLCEVCHTNMETQCKGWLNNLFYHYGRTHIRNDAFLLRSDGYGY